MKYIACKLVRFLSLTLITLVAVSCGGGGGGGGSTAALSTGSVAVLVTDAPNGMFSKILLTINRIELLSDETKALLFSGEERVDLLKLEDESTLFSIASDVPAVAYDKIRLHVSDPLLVKEYEDMNGGLVTEEIVPDLTGNGKLDLNPRMPFMVEPGRMLVLQIDMDANKSIHIHQTGHKDRYKFRPVVFIDILDGIMTGKHVTLEGIVREIDPDNEIFTLCPTDTVFWNVQTASADDHYDDDPDHVSERCVTVNAADASIFDENGDPADFDALMDGDFVTASGLLRAFSDENDDSDDSDDSGDNGSYNEDHELILDAEVIRIRIPEEDDFLKLKGEVLTAPSGTDAFEFALDPGQNVEGDLTVELQPGTRIYSREGDPLDATQIVPGLSATVQGTLVTSTTEGAILKATRVVLDTSEPSGEYDGTISGINDDHRTFDLDLTEGGSLCVTASDAHVFLSATGSDGLKIESADFDHLENGLGARVFGHINDATGCLVADDIFAEVDAEIVID
ncbi:MAG: DUF4382 domain-containing protein [bacterium]|nr:DUF4382 domain-containing protein [bacterium]